MGSCLYTIGSLFYSSLLSDNVLRHHVCCLALRCKESFVQHLTCKARHLKCDEDQPSCRRCIKSGRNCKPGGSAVRELRVVCYVSIPAQSPNTYPSLNEKEQRLFHAFRTRTGLECMLLSSGCVTWCISRFQSPLSSMQFSASLHFINDFAQGKVWNSWRKTLPTRYANTPRLSAF